MFNQLIKFAKSLIGIRYTWWKSGDVEETFYVNGLPSKRELKTKGINCAGLINMLRQFYGNNLPEIYNPDLVKGGTGYWYQYLKSKQVLQPVDIDQKYQIGTLLFRYYRDIHDQGHMAVICHQDTNYLDSWIIHSYYNDQYDNGVGIHQVVDSHWYLGIQSGYYDFTVAPADWLN